VGKWKGDPCGGVLRARMTPETNGKVTFFDSFQLSSNRGHATRDKMWRT
jgi:hypothetical protein